jgi:cytochrome c oxidase subunit 2
MISPLTKLIASLFLALTVTAGFAQDTAQHSAQPSRSADETREIKMSARKYRFDPDVITVKKGQRVRLVITALDRDHGFKIEAFNINQKLKKGDPAIVEFTAGQTGMFPFHCSEFCGLGHRRMKGKLLVEEQ